MPLLDYTKWLNLFDDVQKQAGGAFRQGPPEDYFPLERAPKAPCSKATCQCVRVYSVSQRPDTSNILDHFFQSVTINARHSMFISGRTVISPIAKKIGIPLIVYLEAPLQYAICKPDLRPLYENQPVTFLLAQPSNGLAPMQYQDGVGTALVARLDHEPLSVEELAAINAYIHMLMNERYGRGPADYQVQKTITHADYKRFTTGNHNILSRTLYEQWLNSNPDSCTITL
ncbi:hypothetical protein BDB00DRAFT_817620 [Zychaea mexicana]|uniref:uncharacterized protein n=1 Tax=Zychaea mexicana TaxID=64656 RepID=UPI0022FDCE94|nr:uncharacterized protein BDB00DRAFT_817620 [Zychaea mexicana]KAI9494638.1 hypothetical protein BDB00DRAFT_817620 [Zychaea mexicana]